MAIESWGRSNFSGGGAGTESGRAIKKIGNRSSGRAPMYTPGGGGSTALDTGASPMTYDVNILDPGGTATMMAQETEEGLAGLKNALFGTSAPDAAGQHGGFAGDVPILGAGLRAASETIANVGGAVAGVGKGGLDVIGGAMEHIDLGSVRDHEELQFKFDRLPEGEQKAAALEAIKNDPGATGHYMAKAIKDVEEIKFAEGKIENPDFWSGAMHTPGSAAEAVDNLIGGFLRLGSVGSRTFSEIETPGQGGVDRLELIKMVGRGEVAFNEDKGLLGTGLLAGDPTTGLNAVEAIVFAKTESGEWTDDEAFDFLTAAGQAVSHSAIANIAGEVALDPTIIGSLGTGFLAKGVATGAKLMKAARFADDAVKATEKALDAAKAADAAATGLKKVDTTADMIRLTEQLKVDRALAKTAAHGALRGEKTASRLNPLGKAGESEFLTNALRNMYKTYDVLQQAHVDKAMKVARTMIDPLSAMSLRNPLRKKMVDLMSDDGVKSVIGGYGDGNHARVTHLLADATEGNTTPLADMFSEDIGTFSANLIRRVIARKQRQIALANGLGDALAKTEVEKAIDNTSSKVPRSYNEYILRESNAHRIRSWSDDAYRNLADRMADNYGVKSSDEWLDWMRKKGLNSDELSLLHAATYGRATKRLIKGLEDLSLGLPEKLGTKARRLILINRTTLTQQGATGAIADLKAFVDRDLALKQIEALQRQYPELANFTLDRTAPNAIARFIKDLERRVPHLPMQVNQDELAQLPTDLRSLHDDKTYTLGFAPEDEFKWGMARSNDAQGRYAPVYDVWTDHVAPGAAFGYRSVGQMVEQNMRGQPIVGAVGKKLGRGIDYIDAGIKTMNRSVSGTVIAEAARSKFIQKAAAKYGHVGISESIAKQMMDALETAAGATDIVVRPSGLATKNMWTAVEDIIPKTVTRAEFDKRDLLALVLEAYQGDMRFVGLTQALSSRVKRVLAFEGNNASVLAEQVYPTLKYRLNLVFQLQEKLEPWILNTARGVTPARSARVMNDADKATMTLLQRMADNSLITNADHEMAEYTGRFGIGQTLEQQARASTTATGRMTQKLGVNWMALRDVKGVKQLNMLRTFRKGMGADMRKAWEMHSPGTWDDMYLDAQRRAGKGMLDEDEFAVGLMAEQMLGNEVFVSSVVEGRLKGLARNFDKVEYRNAIKPGTWAAPQTIGELPSLDLDDMADILMFPDGKGGFLRNQADIRAAIAAGDLTLDDVTAALRRLGADPDLVMRVESAYKFSWEGFFDQLEKDFNITPEMSRHLQDYVANAAALRNMTPVDYISQIMVPTIGEGSVEAVMGHLGRVKDILGPEGRVMGQTQELAQLMVKEGGAGTEKQLIDQLASIFESHLDPSAKLALIRAFKPHLLDEIATGNGIDISTANRLWDDDIHQEFVEYLTGELNPPIDLLDAWESGRLRTAADFDKLDPGTPVTIVRDDGVELPKQVQRFLGDGVRNADPRAQNAIMSAVGRMHREFPDVPVRHIDVVDDMTMYLNPGEDGGDVLGVMLETKDGGSVLILNSTFYGKYPGGKDFDQVWADIGASNRRFADDSLMTDVTSREVLPGTPEGINSPTGVVQHEFAHAVDVMIRKRLNKMRKDALSAGKNPNRVKKVQQLQKYERLMNSLYSSIARRRMSGYGMRNMDEMTAEVIALAFSGEVNPADIERVTQKWADLLKAGELRTTPKAWNEPLGIASLDDATEFLDYARGPLGKGDDALRHFLDAFDQYEEDVLLGMATKKEIKESLNKVQEEAWRVKSNDIGFGFDDSPGDMIGDLNPADLEGPESIVAVVDELRTILKDAGIWVPGPEQLDPSLAVRAKPIIKGMKGRENPDVIRAGQMFHKFTKNTIGNHIRGVANAAPSTPVAAPARAVAPISRAEAEAKRLLRVTDDITGAHYMTPDGTLVVGPGEHYESAGKLGGESTVRDAGFIRISGSSKDHLNFDITGPVTPAQKQAMIDSAATRKTVTIDLYDGQFYGDGESYVSNAPGLGNETWDNRRVINVASEKIKGIHAERRAAGLVDDVEMEPVAAAVADVPAGPTPNEDLKGLLDKIDGMPTDQAVPYDYTQARIMDSATEAMRSKWDDAHRLQYYSRERTMLERSINHPMFGIYPASYMWGKMLPEIIRFVSKEPFGVRTGAMAYSMIDIQRNIALQREFDPEFDRKIEELGHSAAFFALGYLMPSWPWEASAAVAGPIREIAAQGNDMQARVDAGGFVSTDSSANGINVVQAGQKAMDVMNPLKALDRTFLAPLEEITDPKAQPDAEAPKYYMPAGTGTVQADELGGTLQDEMDNLRALLGG